MGHFKRYWDEPRGDAHNAWGHSCWYFEADEAGVVSRQVEVYDHGPTLRYHEGHMDDEFGGLADQPLDLGEFASCRIEAEEFERVWALGS